MFKRCLLEHHRCQILSRKTKSRLRKTEAPCWRRSVTRTRQVLWQTFSHAMLRVGQKCLCIWRTKTCWMIWIRIQPIYRIIKVSRWAFWDPITSSIWTHLWSRETANLTSKWLDQVPRKEVRPLQGTCQTNSSLNVHSKLILRFWVVQTENNYKRWTSLLKDSKTLKISKIRMPSLWGRETQLLLASRRRLRIRDRGRSRQIPLMLMSFKEPLNPQVTCNQILPRFLDLWPQEAQDRSTWTIQRMLEVWGQALSRIVNNSSNKPWETLSWASSELPWDQP